MENVLKDETKFQEKLAKYKEMPDDVKLRREIAILFLQRQQVEKALPISEKMPDDVKLNREFAFYYLGKGEAEMEKVLLISEKMPNDVKLNNKIAITYLQLRKINKALTFSEKVFAKDPENKTGLLPTLHIQIGLAYAMKIQAQAGNEGSDLTALTEKAVNHFNMIVDKYPKSKDYETAQYYLGITYSFSKQYDKSIEALEKLINHTTDDQLKKSAQSRLDQVKAWATEAEGETDN